MAQTFLALPNSGASVALPVCEGLKTFYAGGTFVAEQAILEASADGVNFTVAGSISLDSHEPQEISFSAAYVRVLFVNLTSGTPVCFLGINSIGGTRATINLPVTTLPGPGPIVAIDGLPIEKSFFVVGTAGSRASVEVSLDDVNFNPLFTIEGSLFRFGDVVLKNGYYKSARSNLLFGNGSGFAIQVVADPDCCNPPDVAPLVTDIEFNDDPGELSPGFPDPSTWCSNQFTNPPPISITFNQAINPATVTGLTVYLTDPFNVPIAIGPYSFSGGNTVVTFTPVAPLPVGGYVVHVTAGVQNPGGVPVTAVTFEFSAIDCELTITDINLNDDPDQLSPGYPDPSTWCQDAFTNPPLISITFSQPINPGTVTGATVFLLDPALVPVPIGPFSFSGGNTIVSFTPTAPIGLGNYTVQVTAGVQTVLGSPCTPTAFVYNSINCDLNVTDIDLNDDPDQLSPGYPTPSTWCENAFTNPPTIAVTFNQPINPATVTGLTLFLLDPSAIPVPIGPYAFSGGNTVVTFTPLAPLGLGTYTVNVTAGIQTPFGSAATPVVFAYTSINCDLNVTDVELNDDPDQLIPGYPDPSTWCADAFTNPPLISITFNQPINPVTVTGLTVFLLDPSAVPVPIGPYSFSGGNTIVSFTPLAPIGLGTYTVQVTSGVQTPDGSACTAAVFTYNSVNCDLNVADIELNDDPDQLSPGYPTPSTWCQNSFTNPPAISVTFNQSINPATVTGLTLFLLDPSAVPVPIGPYFFSGGNTIVTFTPVAPLGLGTYTVNVTAGVQTPFGSSATPVVFPYDSINCELDVTDIEFNNDPDQLDPGYPTPSTWCADSFTNPPLISITFSQAINPATVTGLTVFVLDPSSLPVAIGPYSFSGGNTVVSFTPTLPVGLGSYTVHVTAGVQTPGGSPATPTVFTYLSMNCADLNVTDINFNVDGELTPGYPAPSAWCGNSFTNPPLIVITFNLPINPATVTGLTVFLTDPASVTVPIGPYSFSGGNTIVSFTPLAALPANVVSYNVHVTAGVQTPGGAPVTAVLFPILIETCVLGPCEAPVYGGSYPDEWTSATGMVAFPAFTAQSRYLPIAGLTQYGFPASPPVIFFMGGLLGSVQSKLVNVYEWSGAFMFTGPPVLASPLPIALGGIPNFGHPYGAVSTAITDKNCNVYVQGELQRTGEFIFEEGPSRSRPTFSNAWDMMSIGFPADAGGTFNNLPYAKTNTYIQLDDERQIWLFGRRRPIIYDVSALTQVDAAVYPIIGVSPLWHQFGACKLLDGRIFMTGGIVAPAGSFALPADRTPIVGATIYDPVTDSWTTVAPMNHARRMHTLVVLNSGRVLAVGGLGSIAPGAGQTVTAVDFLGPVAICEIYDPGTDSWTDISSLITPRSSNATVKLPTGEVMIIGGQDGAGAFLASTEILGAALTWNAGPTLDDASGPLADMAAIVVPHATQYTVILGGGRSGIDGTFGTADNYVSYLTSPTGGPPPFGGPPL